MLPENLILSLIQNLEFWGSESFQIGEAYICCRHHLNVTPPKDAPFGRAFLRGTFRQTKHLRFDSYKPCFGSGYFHDSPAEFRSSEIVFLHKFTVLCIVVCFASCLWNLCDSENDMLKIIQGVKITHCQDAFSCLKSVLHVSCIRSCYTVLLLCSSL